MKLNRIAILILILYLLCNSWWDYKQGKDVVHWKDKYIEALEELNDMELITIRQARIIKQLENLENTIAIYDSTFRQVNITMNPLAIVGKEEGQD